MNRYNIDNLFDKHGVIPVAYENEQAIDYINALIWNSEIREFRVDKYDGSKLTIIGSFDLCYYHDVEINFVEVGYTQLSYDFSDPKFELQKSKEIKMLSFSNIFSEALLCKIYEPDGEYIFYINCAYITVKSGQVVYER